MQGSDGNFSRMDRWEVKHIKCENCGKVDRPAIFKGERFCSDKCAKAMGVKK